MEQAKAFAGSHQEAKASAAQGEVCPKKDSGDGKFPRTGMGEEGKGNHS